MFEYPFNLYRLEKISRDCLCCLRQSKLIRGTGIKRGPLPIFAMSEVSKPVINNHIRKKINNKHNYNYLFKKKRFGRIKQEQITIDN